MSACIDVTMIYAYDLLPPPKAVLDRDVAAVIVALQTCRTYDPRYHAL